MLYMLSEKLMLSNSVQFCNKELPNGIPKSQSGQCSDLANLPAAKNVPNDIPSGNLT